MEASFTLLNSVTWIGFSLFGLEVRETPPRPAFRGFLEEASGDPVRTVAKTGNGDYKNFAIIGKGNGDVINTGATRVVLGGVFELKV